MTNCLLSRLRCCEAGSTATEYALLASLIAAALAGAIGALGSGVEAHYSGVETKYSEAND